MQWSFRIFLAMILIAIILDSLGADSSWVVFLFGLGWLGLLTAGVFWITQKRKCPVCHQPWSLVDIHDFSPRGLKGLFQSCPKCMGVEEEAQEQRR